MWPLDLNWQFLNGTLFLPSVKLNSFFLNPAAETFGADDGALVQAAHDDFVRIACFDLKSNFTVFDSNHLRAAMNCLADRRRREVADVQFNADRTLVGIETGSNGLTRGAFEKADKVWRGHDGGHAVTGKLHGVFHLGRDGQLANFTNSGARLHFAQKKAATSQREITAVIQKLISAANR